MTPHVAPLTKSRTLLYSAGSVGAGAFYAFNNFVLPNLLKAFGASDLLIGLLSSTRSIEGAVIQPTVGALSDRMWTRLGRRRPFMLIGIPLSAVFFVLAAGASDLLTLAVGIVLFSIFFNAAVDPYAALLADIAAPNERGILSGVSTGIQLLSQVVFLIVVPPAAACDTTIRNTAWLSSWIPVDTPERIPRSLGAAMSARSAAYGSTAALKKMENRTIPTARVSRSEAPAARTKKTAESGIPISMNGRRRPSRVHIRSDRAPTVGWMTAPSMLRVLDRSPISRSLAPNAFSRFGSTKLL